MERGCRNGVQPLNPQTSMLSCPRQFSRWYFFLLIKSNCSASWLTATNRANDDFNHYWHNQYKFEAKTVLSKLKLPFRKQEPYRSLVKSIYHIPPSVPLFGSGFIWSVHMLRRASSQKRILLFSQWPEKNCSGSYKSYGCTEGLSATCL